MLRVSKSSKYAIACSQVIGVNKIVRVEHLILFRMYF